MNVESELRYLRIVMVEGKEVVFGSFNEMVMFIII